MPRQPERGDPEKIRAKLVQLLTNFDEHLRSGDLRNQVKQLVPVNYLLRDMGASLIQEEPSGAARDRILLYLKRYVGHVVHGDELMVVAGISEYARRVRELRVQMGWKIMSGVTARAINAEAVNAGDDQDMLPDMRTDEYLLLESEPDRDAAFRWNLANDIRKSGLSVKDKILKYLRENVGQVVTGEELRYLAKGKTEWARRVRELRTEDGWPVATKQTGRPELQVGTYVLEKDRQAPSHDRKIPDPVRAIVLRRDEYSCQGELKEGEECGWNRKLWTPDDPRNLELHHVIAHVERGPNEPDNLITLCNICHDEIHRRE